MSKFPEQSDGYKLMEWIDGAADCRHGRPFQEGRSEFYQDGWKGGEFCKEQKREKISELGKLL